MKRAGTFLTIGLWVGLILWLRLRVLGYTELWEDQALTLNMALEWVHGGALPLASMKSSFGIFNPPLVEYLYALPLFFKPDLLGVVWLVALINLGGIFALGFALARIFHWRVAVMGLTLFAVNPWAAYYGRLIWMQSFVPGFAAGLFACVLLYFTVDHRPRYLVLAALCFAAVVQVHLTAITLGAVWLILALWFAREIHWRAVLLGGALFSLSFAPFILYQVRTGWADLATLREGLSQSPETNFAAFLNVLDLLHAQGVYATFGGVPDMVSQSVDALVTGLLLLGLGAPLVALLSQRGVRALSTTHMAELIAFLWVSVPPLLFIRHSQYLQNYYFLYLYPALFTLLACFAERLGAWFNARWRWVAYVPLGLIILHQAQFNLIAQDQLAAGRFGRQRIVDVAQLIETAQQLMQARPTCALVTLAEGARYEDSRFALLREFVDPRRVRFASIKDGYLIPSPCAVYFLATAEPQPPAWLVEHTHAIPTLIHTPSETWTFHDLSDESRAQWLAQIKTPAALAEWANGVSLLRAQAQGVLDANGSLMLLVEWGITQAVEPREIHFGNYLLNAQREVVAQQDGAGPDSAQWQAGDIFQTTFTLSLPADLPPGDYALYTALYYYPEIERIPLVSSVEDMRLMMTLSKAP